MIDPDPVLLVRIKVLKQSLSDSEKLTQELFKDKDRVGRILKRDAPHIYRRLQLDIFTELSLYKKKTLCDMNEKLYSTANMYVRGSKIDKDSQTHLRDVKNHIVRQY